MAADALPRIATSPAPDLVDLVCDRFAWTKTALAALLQTYRPTVSNWSRGKYPMDERTKAALRFLQAVPAPEPAGLAPEHLGARLQSVGLPAMMARCAALPPGSPERWAPPSDPEGAGDAPPDPSPSTPAPLRGLPLADAFDDADVRRRIDAARRRELGPLGVFDIRQRLGWIQAEMGAGFGTVPSTVAVWEGPDPGFGPATTGPLLALDVLRQRQAGTLPTPPIEGALPVRDLWQMGVSALLARLIARGIA